MKELFLKLLSLVAGVSKKLWDLIAPILKSETGKLLEQILPIALEVVKVYATDGKKSGDEKRAAAFKDIEAKAKAAGIVVGTSIINLAIETALANLKVSDK